MRVNEMYLSDEPSSTDSADVTPVKVHCQVSVTCSKSSFSQLAGVWLIELHYSQGIVAVSVLPTIWY